MRVFDILRLRLRTLLHRRRLDRELEEEVRYHFERQIQHNLGAGMNPAQARIAAIHRVGSAAHIQEQCREQRGFGFVAGLFRDLAYGLRAFRREPVFVAAVTATLALGIGVNTAAFTIGDTLLLRSLPLSEPERLFQILQPDGPGLTRYGELFAVSDFRDFSEHTRHWARLAAETESAESAASIDGAPEEPLRRTSVTENYFETLAVDPAIGRTFSPKHDSGAVIGYGLWKRRFQADASVLGRSIRIGAVIYTVVGVAQPGFTGLEAGTPVEIWTSLGPQPPHSRTIRLIGRLTGGATLQQAAAPLQAVFHQRMLSMAANAPPGTPRTMLRRIEQLQLDLVSAANGVSPLRGGASGPMWVVFGLVALVFLLACATVATLFEARRSVRRHEMAVRLSLGAGRRRLLRQLLCEGLPIAATAALLSLLLAHYTAPLLVSRLTPGPSPIQLPSGIDSHVLAFTAALSFAAALLFGIVPAWRSSSVPPGALNAHSRDIAGARAGKAMVAFQVAVSLALVMTATLFVRTLLNLTAVEPGFDLPNIVVAAVEFRAADRGDRLALAWEDLRRRVAGIPGVQSASLASGSAFNGSSGNGMLRLPGIPPDPTNSGCVFFSASAGFFSTSGIRLLAGRDFEPRDFHPGAPPVAVVSQTLARQFFHDRQPVGRVFANFEDAPPRWINVIGVARDTRFENLRNAPARVVYLPYTWPHPSPFLSLVLRTRRDAGSLASSLRREAAAAGPDFLVRQVTTQTALVDKTLTRERLLAGVASFFALLALLIAAVGLYGIMSFTVSQRTSEIGVRMALGAARGAVLRMVLRESASVTLIGAAAGLAISLVAGRLVSALLFGAKVYDPQTLAGPVALVMFITIAAAFIPARRAARIDPISALRYE